MIPLTLAEIAEITGGELHDVADPDTQVTGSVEFDSRKITPGGLFLALPGAQVDGHDYAALTAAARDLKQRFPAESTVTITAEGDVPMDVLVRTLDALRGDSCKLGGYIHGEQPGDACLFWSPVIESVG